MTIKIPAKVEEFIKANICFTYIGMLPCHYAKLTDFELMQHGYRFNPVTQENLVSNFDGGWKENWFVIACNVMNEPFFVDFSQDDKGFPVYYAYHGRGRWDAIEVSNNIKDFQSILEALKEQEDNEQFDLTVIANRVNFENPFWKEVLESCDEE